jgi:uncharacterized membrane protein YbhN (UPF0104 family)
LRAALGLGLLGGIFLTLNPQTILKELAGLTPIWVAAAAACIVAATLLGAFNAHLILCLRGELPLWRFLPLYWISWAVGLVFPGQVGDVAGISILLRRHQVAWHISVGRAMADKLISLSVIAVFATYGLLEWLGAAAWAPILIPLLSLGGAVLLLLMTMPPIQQRLAHYAKEGRGTLHGDLGSLAPSAPDPHPARHRVRLLLIRAAGFLARMVLEIQAIARHHPYRVLVNAVLTVLKFAILVAAYLCMFRAAGLTGISLVDLMPLVAMCSLVAYIPVSLNGMGTVELAGILLFARLGVSSPTVLSTYIVLRLLGLLLAWVPAGLWLLSQRAVDPAPPPPNHG